MVTILICMLPLSFVLGGFLAIKSVQLGLRWQIQTKHDEKPTVNTPIATIKQMTEEKKVSSSEVEQENVIKEWIFGAEEKR